MQEGQKFVWETEFLKCAQKISRAASINEARKIATAFLDINDGEWGDEWPLRDQVIQCLKNLNFPIPPPQTVLDNDEEATDEWMEYVAEAIYNSASSKGKEEEEETRPQLQEFLKEARQLDSSQLVKKCVKNYMESQTEETIRAEMTMLYPDMMKQWEISKMSIQIVLLIFLVGAQTNKNDEGEKKKKKEGNKRARKEEEEVEEVEDEVGPYLAELQTRCNPNNNNNNNHVVQPETTKEAYLE